MPFQIAIDGPVAAGKGTAARLIAERLGLLYVDTGAMYRTAALLAKRHNIALENPQQLVELIRTVDLYMRNPSAEELDGRLTTVLVNGEDVSWAIRTPEISSYASKVAAMPEVRQILVEKQQKIAESQDIIMEGRDITFRVLPAADLRIFLTAEPAARAQRRHAELQSKGTDISLEEVARQLQERDQYDMSRDVDPLHVAEGVWVVDTSTLSIDEVVDMICQRATELRKGKTQADVAA